MKIIVLNLNKTMDESRVAKLFAKHGKVDSCSLVLDKETQKSKGFGFIEMPDDAEATAAIAALHGSQVSGNKIRVKVSDKNDE